MTTATMFTLSLVTLAATASTVQTVRGASEDFGVAVVRWTTVYVVAVVVPWAWAVYRIRVGVEVKDAAAPALVGCMTAIAAQRVVTSAPAEWSTVAIGLLVATVLVATGWRPRR